MVFTRAEKHLSDRVCLNVQQIRGTTQLASVPHFTTKFERMVPELLEANGFPASQDVPYELLARRFSVVHRVAA